jgi:hypothetical protein
LSYQWSFNGMPLSSATSSTLALTNVQPADAGSYAVTVTNPWGSITSAVATLNVLATMQIAASQDTYIRSAATTFNYGAATRLVVDRSGGGIGDQRALVRFDLSSIPAGATITSATLQMQATANGGAFNINIYRVTQSWVEGSGNATAGVANWSQRAPGTNWSSSGGDYNTTVVATLNTGSIGQHSWDLTTLVQGWQSGSIVNNGIIIGSPDTGTTTITYDSREGATPPRLLISYGAPPTITTQPQDQTVARNSDAAFSVTTDGTAPLSYQWSFNGTPLAGATGSTLTLNNVQTNDAGSYTVTVTNSLGSVTSAAATLTVMVLPEITTQPQSQTVLSNESVTFLVVAASGTPLSYQWYKDGSVILNELLAGQTASSLTLSNVGDPDLGQYFVQVRNAGGTVTSRKASLTVLPNSPPVANNDIYSTPEDVPLVIPAAGILTNDTDVNGQALTALLVTNVSQGSLSLNVNGSFTYTPNTNFNGSDSFTYRASNGGNVAATILQENASGGNKEEVKLGQKGAQSFQHGTAGGSCCTFQERQRLRTRT